VSHFDAIRRQQSAVQNAVIDEYLAGRIGRRAFLRYAAALGITAPLLTARRRQTREPRQTRAPR
jgi:hypothetical protein